MKIVLIGHGAREHVIAETLKKNHYTTLYSYLKSKNPGIINLSENFFIGDYSDLEDISGYVKKIKPDFAFIGSEDPLINGAVDLLNEMGIEAVAPTKNLARLETSKSFTRDLLEKYKIKGNPMFKTFNKDNVDDAYNFINSLESCVIKPDGLTGGKGVKVQGDHFSTNSEAFEYCKEVLKKHPWVIVEEKLDGEEFSLQCFTDGKTVITMPPAQDHKRALIDDKGENTGGMGSYSCEDHLLPFLTKNDIEEGLDITKKVVNALKKETGQYYKGIMYGGFILTKYGVKLLEYNARFGDPEAMNVLPLLETDFVDVCNAIINQKLGSIKVKFEEKATVCKYLVPEGYPDAPLKNQKIEIISPPKEAKIYYASVEQRDNKIYTTSSRAIACLGIGDTLEKAEKISEESAKSIKGKVVYRKDIGTAHLIEKRVRHIKELLLL